MGAALACLGLVSAALGFVVNRMWAVRRPELKLNTPTLVVLCELVF